MFRRSEIGGCQKLLLACTSGIDIMSNTANSRCLDELRLECDSLNESPSSDT